MTRKLKQLIIDLTDGWYIKKVNISGQNDCWLVKKDEEPCDLDWKIYHELRNNGFGIKLGEHQGYLYVTLNNKGLDYYKENINEKTRHRKTR